MEERRVVQWQTRLLLLPSALRANIAPTVARIVSWSDNRGRPTLLPALSCIHLHACLEYFQMVWQQGWSCTP